MNRQLRIEIQQAFCMIIATVVAWNGWGWRWGVLTFCAASLFGNDAIWNYRDEPRQ